MPTSWVAYDGDDGAVIHLYVTTTEAGKCGLHRVNSYSLQRHHQIRHFILLLTLNPNFEGQEHMAHETDARRRKEDNLNNAPRSQRKDTEPNTTTAIK